MRLYECLLLQLTKVSATYLICFSLEGDLQLLMGQEEGKLHLTFLRKK